VAGTNALDLRARKALERLLQAAERNAAGTSSRQAALTASSLTEYHASKTLRDKEDFEATMLHAQAEGAIRLVRPRLDPDGMIERVELSDIDRLAAVLGHSTVGSQVAAAEAAFASLMHSFPVLAEVVSQWRTLKRVRGSGVADYRDWVDAAATVEFCREAVRAGRLETPLRVASARLFNDSKRIEKLGAPLDVLLTGEIDSPPRELVEVWQELGLYREEQPIRMAGLVSIRRERGEGMLDRPYGAFPASTVLGLASQPSMVLTIENLTTFHVDARVRAETDVLCIYSMGMPSPAWLRMYVNVLRDVPAGTPIRHWGDIDEGGFRIAAFIGRAAQAAGHRLEPWRMTPSEVPASLRVPVPPSVVQRMAAYARSVGWEEVAAEVEALQFTVEQEGLD